MPPRMRREDRRLVAILGFLHGMVHTNILSMPLFLNLAWGPEFQADDVTLGLLAAIGFGFYGVSSVPIGYLADRRDPGGLLFLCAAGIAASNVLLAVSPTIPVLAISLAALGLFSGIYHPTGLSTISRTVTEQGRAMGWHGMGGSLGIAAGPAFVGGSLALGWSWRLVAGVLIVPAIVSAALLVLRPPGPQPDVGARAEPSGPARRLMTAPYALILLVYMFAGFAYQGVLTFLPKFIPAGFFVLALALGAFGQVVSGTLADRRHPNRLLFTLSLAAAGTLLILGVSSPGGLFTLAAVAFGYLLFSLEPLQNTLVTAEVPRALRGLAFGGTFLSVFGIGSIGAALAGRLVAQNQTAILFALLAGCLTISGTLALGIRRARASP